MTADPRVESVAKARAGERYQTAVLSEGNVLPFGKAASLFGIFVPNTE